MAKQTYFITSTDAKHTLGKSLCEQIWHYYTLSEAECFIKQIAAEIDAKISIDYDSYVLCEYGDDSNDFIKLKCWKNGYLTAIYGIQAVDYEENGEEIPIEQAAQSIVEAPSTPTIVFPIIRCDAFTFKSELEEQFDTLEEAEQYLLHLKDDINSKKHPFYDVARFCKNVLTCYGVRLLNPQPIVLTENLTKQQVEKFEKRLKEMAEHFEFTSSNSVFVTLEASPKDPQSFERIIATYSIIPITF